MNQRKSRKKNRYTEKQRCMQKNKLISLMYVVHYNLMKLNEFIERNQRLIQKGERT